MILRQTYEILTLTSLNLKTTLTHALSCSSLRARTVSEEIKGEEEEMNKENVLVSGRINVRGDEKGEKSKRNHQPERGGGSH